MSFLSFGPTEAEFLSMMFVCIVVGYIIGAERESRGKEAGIGTHILVISGSALFTFISGIVDPESTSRIAAQVVAGIGFLGAGLIIRDGVNVKNLTTAASLWVSAAVGMAIGYGMTTIAIIGAILTAVAPRLPHLQKKPNGGSH